MKSKSPTSSTGWYRKQCDRYSNLRTSRRFIRAATDSGQGVVAIRLSHKPGDILKTDSNPLTGHLLARQFPRVTLAVRWQSRTQRSNQH